MTAFWPLWDEGHHLLYVYGYVTLLYSPGLTRTAHCALGDAHVSVMCLFVLSGMIESIVDVIHVLVGVWLEPKFLIR